MSTPEEKIVHGTRIQNKKNAINKQLKIAKQHGMTNSRGVVPEPHRFAKTHAPSGVGDPEKYHSSHNPRKDYNERTIQEQRMIQSTEEIRNRHTNGIDDTK